MVTLKIEGMTCGHCVMAVKAALAAVAGVEGPVDVNLATGEARVGGAPQTEALVAAVVAEGYQATVVA